MSGGLTRPALREVVRAALLTPTLTYKLDQGNGTYADVAIAAANLVPRSAWSDPAPKVPSPAIAFEVMGKGPVMRTLDERKLELGIWCVANDEMTAEFVYAAVYDRLNAADQNPGFSESNLSRAAAASHLGLVIRECVEIESAPCSYDAKTARWFVYGRFRIIAR